MERCSEPVFIRAVEESAPAIGTDAQNIEVIPGCLHAPGRQLEEPSPVSSPTWGMLYAARSLEAAIPQAQVEIVGIRLAGVLVTGAFYGIEAF